MIEVSFSMSYIAIYNVSALGGIPSGQPLGFSALARRILDCFRFFRAEVLLLCSDALSKRFSSRFLSGGRESLLVREVLESSGIAFTGIFKKGLLRLEHNCVG